MPPNMTYHTRKETKIKTQATNIDPLTKCLQKAKQSATDRHWFFILCYSTNEER